MAASDRNAAVSGSSWIADNGIRQADRYAVVKPRPARIRTADASAVIPTYSATVSSDHRSRPAPADGRLVVVTRLIVATRTNLLREALAWVALDASANERPPRLHRCRRPQQAPRCPL